jgi:hypothetical protein
MRNVLLGYAITKEAWDTAQQTEDKREKIQALSLAKECYSMKLDLLTNATVIDAAIRFVSDRQKEYQKSSLDNSNEDDKEESKVDHHEELRQINQLKPSTLGPFLNIDRMTYNHN